MTDLSFDFTCPLAGWNRPQQNMDVWSGSQKDCLPPDSLWHLPQDCAYSKLMGLKKTKMLFLLEPYLAAVLFSFSLVDKYMLTKAKQNKENKNRRTLYIYLEPSGFSTPSFFQRKYSARKHCTDMTPPHPHSSLYCTHKVPQSSFFIHLPFFWCSGELSSQRSCLPQWGLFSPGAIPTSSHPPV